MGACVELVQEEAVGFSAGNHAGRGKDTDSFLDPGHTDNIFRCKLTPQQGDTWKAKLL
jgi:hypothetical protein